MTSKMNSRKLWVAIITIALILALIVANTIYKLGLPANDLLYLALVAMSYILGQGFVDAKNQSVKGLPVEDVTQSISNIMQAELAKVNTGIPAEQLTDLLRPLIRQELSNLNLSVQLQTQQPENGNTPVV